MSQDTMVQEEVRPSSASQDGVVLKNQPAKGPAQLPADTRVSEGLPAGDNGTQYLGVDYHLTEQGKETVRAYGLDPEKLTPITEPTQIIRGSGDGSRHTLQPNEHLFKVEQAIDFPLIGGFFILREGPGARYVKTHPQHAEVSSDLPGWYVERFQRAPSPDTGVSTRTAVEMRRD